MLACLEFLGGRQWQIARWPLIYNNECVCVLPWSLQGTVTSHSSTTGKERGWRERIWNLRVGAATWAGHRKWGRGWVLGKGSPFGLVLFSGGRVIINSLPFLLPPKALLVELSWLQLLTLQVFICTEVVRLHENSAHSSDIPTSYSLNRSAAAAWCVPCFVFMALKISCDSHCGCSHVFHVPAAKVGPLPA